MNVEAQMPTRALALALLVAILALPSGGAFATWAEQQPETGIERPGPPALDEIEADSNGDGVPDGWYNARDAVWKAEGGVSGPHFMRFECTRRGREARLSRAFGIDGKSTGAIILGLWIRLNDVQYGERMGQEPSLLIDFLGDELRHLRRGVMGPWTKTVGNRWTRVVKRIAVPPGTKDAIMSVGLLGASGILDVDGLSIELIPRAHAKTTNLVVNGDFELGDPAPAGWIVNNEAHRVFPGHQSAAAVELAKVGARVLSGLSMPVDGMGSLEVVVSVRAQGLRGAGGAWAAFFFLDNSGEIIPGSERGVSILDWGGSFDWREERAEIRVPAGAIRAVIQFEKSDGLGSIRIDDLRVTASPNPELGEWTPFEAADDTDNWLKVPPSPGIVEGSALDFSFLVPGPAGRKGFVTVKEGRLAFAKGDRARFHGVTLLPPTAFLEPDRSAELADRLARSGINLVRIGDLDSPLGPDRSLFDDSRDDTKAFDPLALGKLDHLIAALKARGIYVALELQSNRRFRAEDGVALPGLLPPGGGPAAIFDPTIQKLVQDAARRLLGRVNPRTGLALKDDPALAWVTLAGEISLFDLIDRPDAVPGEYATALRALAQKSPGGTGRRFWQSLESAELKSLADTLRKAGLKVPVAGVSHWRREPEFAAAQGAPGLDLVDDRLFWAFPSWISPELRSQLWSLDGGLMSGAARKRHAGRPYVVGQWCPQSLGAWALPHEAADQLLAAQTAANEDWDGLVRRGIFVNPTIWGEGPVGTVGGEDIFQLPEVANGSPQVYALWPHCASLLLRGHSNRSEPEREGEAGARGGSKRRARSVPGWDPSRGRLVVDTPFTQGLAGWNGGEPATFPNLDVDVTTPFAVVVATSIGTEPIASARRILVTAIARVEPTGFRWVDEWKREVADPGGPPFLQEPVAAQVSWRRKGTIKAFALDNTGKRIGPARVDPLRSGDGVMLTIDGRTPAFHWELVCE